MIMIKDWKEFITESKDLNKIGDLGLKKYNPNTYNLVGLDENEISDYFYILDEYKFYLSDLQIKFIDKDGWMRRDIKIGESLRPCIYISISSQSTSKPNNNTINEIKGVLNKIKAVSRFKSNNYLNKIVVFDPNISSRGEVNIKTQIIKLEDPFSIISIEGNKIKYNNNDDVTLSIDLDVCLYSENQVKITDEDFYKFYMLEGADAIDKDGKIWSKFHLKDVSSVIFNNDDLVDKYFEPEDFYYDTYNIESSYIIDDIVSSINDENKEKLLKSLNIDEINSVTENDYKDIEDLIKNISNDDFKDILKNLNNDIINDITWGYNDQMNIKYQQEAEEYIKDETIKYIDKYIKFDYYLHKGDVEEIWIKYNPMIFEPGYEENNDPEDWSDWADKIHGESIEQSINEILDEHSGQIRWDDTLGDDIYLSNKEINDYLKSYLY